MFPVQLLSCQYITFDIGLYRDVWIAAIASSTTSLATRTAAICVRCQGRRVRRVYVTMQITFLTRKSALIYRRGLRQRVASLTLNCNGVFAIRAYSVQLIQIATRNKTNLWKMPRFWRLKQLCARHSYVCRQALYVVYIVTQTHSFRRSRDLDKSNTFGQMKELTNDYYSEIMLHNIFHIAYKAIEFITNKKEPTISFPIPILERQRGSHWSWPPMADSCIILSYLIVILTNINKLMINVRRMLTNN